MSRFNKRAEIAFVLAKGSPDATHLEDCALRAKLTAGRLRNEAVTSSSFGVRIFVVRGFVNRDRGVERTG